MTVLDWRDRQKNPPDLIRGQQKHALDRGGKVVERNPAEIRGIVLHQSACVFGAKKGDPDRYHRAFGVACHALTFNDGTVVLPNPLKWLVWHGNGFNDTTLGVEVEGRFPGLVGRLDTLAGPPPETPLTPAMVAGAREAVRVLVELGRAEGMPLTHIYAHRQSNPSRRSDPGQALWQAVVVEYAIPTLGLATEPGRVLQNREGQRGRAIPASWDPEGVGLY